MAVLRKERRESYTVIDNSIFKDGNLSMKAIGLLCLMLSLPDYWDYSIAGLVSIVKDGESAVRSALKELETAGYFRREQVRENGKIAKIEYVISEYKNCENLLVENLKGENLIGENQGESITKESITKKSNTKELSSSLHSEDIYNDEPKKADKKKTKLTMKDVYQNLPEELADTLKDFEDMRKAIKKVATPNAMKLILKDLDRLAGDDTEKKIAILEQSIKNSWQGVFPLREEQNNGNKNDIGRSKAKRTRLADRVARSDDGFVDFEEA